MAIATIEQTLLTIKNWVLGKAQEIWDLIPSQASSSNKLADKAFVNSSIATATATYRGNYNVVTDLSLSYNATHAQIQTALATKMSALSIVPDNNDYAFVQIPTADATPTEIAKIEKYKYNGSAWAYEYELNNSGFTAAQWAAINSGATLELIGKLQALPTNAELIALLDGKQNVIADLAAIRSGATAGASAVQPNTLAAALVQTVAEAGVYDVTANNDGATFDDLEDLLSDEHLATLIPEAVRAGGMAIKFVTTSDNKYVQFRLTNQNWSTVVTDWQVATDDKAENIKYNNSQSGLASNNVQGALDLCSSKHDLNYYSYVNKYYLDENGEPTYRNDSYLLLAKFVVYGGETVAIKGRSGNTGTLASVRNSSGAQIAQYEIGQDKVYTDLDPFIVTLPQGSAYLYVTGHKTFQPPKVSLTSDLKNVENEFNARCDYATIYPNEGAKYIHNNQGEGNICDITDNSNFVADSNYAYYLTDCVEGDSFKITGDGASDARLFCFLDSSMKILLMADVNASYTEYILRAPVNSAYLVVNISLNIPYSLKKAYKTSETISAINELEKDVTYQEITSYTEFPYTIVNGIWKIFNHRTSCLIYVAHIRGKRIQLFPNPTKSTYKIAFFNSVPVLGAAAPYCFGTEPITSDEEYQTIPNDALYLWVRYNNPDEDGLWYPSKIIMPYGINNMFVRMDNTISNIEGEISNIEGEISNIEGEISNIEGEMKEVNPNSLGVMLYNYDGLKPNFKNQFGVTLLQTLPSWVRSQGCAVIGDYMIVGMAFDNNNNAKARVYNLSTNEMLGQITFNFGNYYKAHSNTICFGVEYPDANSPFPALYLSQLDNTGLANKGSEFGVLVYSISSSYVSTFLQAIIPDKTDQVLMSAIGSGTPNYIVDAENGNLWVVGYKYASWVNRNNIQTFVKFKLPLLSGGTEIVLTHDDILDSFELPMSPYSAVQESIYKNGRIYCQMGIDSLVIQGLRIVNVETHSIETSLLTTQIFTTEPQGIAFYNNDMIWYDSNQNGSLYKFNFY